MDFCYTCQRIVNGALVCPGCGAYAPEPAPAAATVPGGHHDGMYPTGPQAGFAPEGFPPAAHPAEPAPLPEYAPAPHAGMTRFEQALFEPPAFEPTASEPTAFAPAEAPGGGEKPPAESVLGPAAIAPTLHRGRAARRRQMARWKKSRRRAGVATAFALFSGGVTVASLHAHGGKGGATTASSDTVTPVNLETRTSPGNGPSSLSQQAPAPAHHATPGQHTSAGTPSVPSVQATHTVTDNAGSVRIANGTTSGGSTTHTGQSPQATTTTAPSSSDSGTSTSGGTDTTATGSAGTSSGGTTTATTPPATSTPSTPPATTSPTTPPQQGLCILILCID